MERTLPLRRVRGLHRGKGLSGAPWDGLGRREKGRASEGHGREVSSENGGGRRAGGQELVVLDSKGSEVTQDCRSQKRVRARSCLRSCTHTGWKSGEGRDS